MAVGAWLLGVALVGGTAAAQPPPIVLVFQTTHALSQRLTELPST